MENPRTYGDPPYAVALLHGGPGALGEMAPVARELAVRRGVLEPLQTRNSVEGQIQELQMVLEEHAALPALLVGYSWGAWLGLLTAARYPDLVQKLILVSSGPFEEKYAGEITQTRLGRLCKREKDEAKFLLRKKIEGPEEFARLGELMAQADDYDPLPLRREGTVPDPEQFGKVWPEAALLRKSGKLLEEARKVQCPVTALHGDHDPHPAQGVEGPLKGALAEFKFILLEKCGHTPWMEKQARENFFRVLEAEGA
jgi:pimeloyl-ACP methyl ester carboxylesterase